MNDLDARLQSLASTLGLHTESMALLLLLVAGVAAHLLLGYLVRRLHRAVEANSYNWDDVVVTALARPGDVLLVKASRVVGLERVVAALAAAASVPDGQEPA